MLNSPLLKKPVWLALPIFHVLFWKENPGVNLLLFGLFLLVVLGLNHPQSLRHRKVLILLTLQLLVGCGAAFIGSSIAFFTFFLLLTVNSVLLRQPSYTSPYLPFLQSLFQFFVAPAQAFKNLPKPAFIKIPVARVAYFSVWPLALVIVFFAIYATANPVLGQWSANSWKWLGTWFEDVSIAWMLFMGLGLWIIATFWQQLWATDLEKWDHGSTELLRKRLPIKSRKIGWRALQLENAQWVVALLALNLLLLVVNIIDIKWIWFGFSVPNGFSLKDFVHDGTGLLVFSILLSMATVLFFFRGNLNFFRGNRWLKLFAYCWIGQNILLTVSVFLRNGYYVDFHGLAPGRIFVIYFLGLTLFGLAALAWKVYQRKSAFWLIRINSWAVVGTFVLASLVDHSAWIAGTNLHHHKANEIDIDYYLQLSPTTYPMLFEHLDNIEAQMAAHKKNEVIWVHLLQIADFEKVLANKARNFIREYEVHGWPSHTWADVEAYRKLKVRFPEENQAEKKES